MVAGRAALMDTSVLVRHAISRLPSTFLDQPARVVVFRILLANPAAVDYPDPVAQAGAGIAKREVRVRTRGRPSSQATKRSRLIADAVAVF